MIQWDHRARSPHFFKWWEYVTKQPDEAYIKHATDYFSKQAARKAQREDRASYKKENRDIDQILKYKELLDKGIITQEEFDAKMKEPF